MSNRTLKMAGASINAMEYAAQGNAVLGIRGAGKTYTAKVLAEFLMGCGIPITVFDPIGVWRFLRVNGLGKGFPIVVAGGEHGDLPLNPHNAEEIVRAAMAAGVSIVLDLYSSDLSKADWRRIVEACVRVQLHENKLYGLRHIFIEEAAEFVPQRIAREQGKVYDQMERLARMGGNALLGYTLINQRSEEVNKAVLELCDSLFLHRQKGKNSLNNLTKWLDLADAKSAREIITSLPSLPTGECWGWLAGSDVPVRIKVPPKRSFEPDRQAMRGGVPNLKQATVDVSKFVEGLRAALPKIAAEADANDPEKLRARIRELEGTPAGASKAELKAEWERGYGEGQLVWNQHFRKSIVDVILPAIQELAGDAAQIQETCQAIVETIQRGLNDRPDIGAPPPSPEPQWRNSQQVKRERDAKRAARPDDGAPADSGGDLPSGEMKVLKAVAMYPNGATHEQLTLLTAYKRSSRNEYIRRLASRGAVETHGDRVQATPAGIALLGSNFERLPTGRALQTYWLDRLPAGEAKILDIIIRAHPKPCDRDAIGEAVGFKRSSRNEYIRRLSARQLIKTEGESVSASPDLMR